MDISKILGPEWAAYLPRAEEFLAPIAERLKDEKKLGITILPQKELIFRIFKETKPSEVRVLLIGQDPYHNPIGQATGRAFECGRYPSASWRKVAEIYSKEVVAPDPQVISGNLEKWASQGVFLMNKAMTVRHKGPNSHTRFWEPFTYYVVGQLLTDMNPKAMILLGAEASKMIPRTPGPHKGFYYEHPAAAAYQRRLWNAEGIFQKVNEFLNFHDKSINF